MKEEILECWPYTCIYSNSFHSQVCVFIKKFNKMEIKIVTGAPDYYSSIHLPKFKSLASLFKRYCQKQILQMAGYKYKAQLYSGFSTFAA